MEQTAQFSFEFFPVRTPQAKAKLAMTWERLTKLKPDFFSVTFGAGGSRAREATFESIKYINDKTEVQAVPHISCIGVIEDEVKELLESYRAMDITKLMILRGDIPSGSIASSNQFRYANELVEFIRKETGDYFHLEVAAYPEFHPQAPRPSIDLSNFKRKIEAGANGALTQYFYNPYAYFRFLDDCEKLGINVPIVPGVMPIIRSSQLIRFSANTGAEIPRWILLRLQELGDDKIAIRKFGIDVATELCDRLLSEGAPGIHFYTMNQAASSEAIWDNLGLNEARGNNNVST